MTLIMWTKMTFKIKIMNNNSTILFALKIYPFQHCLLLISPIYKARYGLSEGPKKRFRFRVWFDSFCSF